MSKDITPEQEAERLYPANDIPYGYNAARQTAHITAARQYMGEIERLKEGVEILKDLCGLKAYKDSEGKDAYYEHEQPKLWKRANDFLEALKTNTHG